MRYAIYIVAAPLLLALLSLTGCGESNPLDPDNTGMICRDGVQYMTFEKLDTKGALSVNVVPHFKRDGSLYPCVDKPKKH